MIINLLDARQRELVLYIILCTILTYFIGMRNLDLGSDTLTYYRYFNFVKYDSVFIGAERIEIGFYWLTKLIAVFTDSEKTYLSIIFLIQLIGITSAINKKSEIFKSYLLMTLVWMTLPFFYSITLNVIRQGLAFVFVVYALDAKLQNKKYSSYLILLLGSLFHYPSVVYLIGFMFLELNPRASVTIGVWLVAVLLAFSGVLSAITQSILSLIIPDGSYFSYYLLNNNSYEVGFKLRFVIFSALPIGYYFLLNHYKTEGIEKFLFIFNLYLIINIFYLFTVNLPFNDRFAIASWLLFPFMIDFKFLTKIRIFEFFKIGVVFSSISVFVYYIFYLPR